jgi:hypothetical protein
MRVSCAAKVRGASIVIALFGAVWVASAAGASGGDLTLRASRPYVSYGQGVTLEGTATAHGRAIADATIIVAADGFPFRAGFRPITSRRTDAGGGFRIVVHPSHATEYRFSVAGGHATSSTVTVYVVPRDVASCNLCGFNNSAGSHELIVGDVFHAPPGPLTVQRSVYFYYGQRVGSGGPPATIRLVERVPLVKLAGNRLEDTVHYEVHFPAERFQFSYVTCYRDAEAMDGLGLPGHHHCGDPTLTRAEYSGYLG